MRHFSSGAPVLVVGAGVAGMQAALDLANLGTPVYLAEQEAHLGGQVLRLDKVYPTDHCAFCPTWTHARACREHPLVTVSAGTRFRGLEQGAEGWTAILAKPPRPIDADVCIFCGTCMTLCPRKAILPHAPDLPWDPSSAPVPCLDAGRCDGCGQCVAACPVGAIALHREAKTLRLIVSDCIFAGGFIEPKPAPAPEFGAHTHPDILTAMDFEAWTAEFAAKTSSVLCCPSDNRPVRRLVFIQCAGARDRRHLAHCSAVCCMHATKQASWMKRRQPDMELIILYTDLRGPGKGQEAYLRSAEKLGVQFFRRRPGLVAPVDGPAGKGIAVRHEANGRVTTTLVDMVVLNGGLARCPYPDFSAPVEAARELLPERLCGFCSEPADIAHSVIQAGNAAALAYAGQKRGNNVRALSTIRAAAGETS